MHLLLIHKQQWKKERGSHSRVPISTMPQHLPYKVRQRQHKTFKDWVLSFKKIVQLILNHLCPVFKREVQGKAVVQG